LLANQVVEGFISGMHKSPFHGFSAEFAEHKVYNVGESTKHIDWNYLLEQIVCIQSVLKKKLICVAILLLTPHQCITEVKTNQNFHENKIGFSVLASAVLMNLLKKQRDAIGLSVFSDTYEYYAPEKGSDRHQNGIECT
jgi:uncharacterized protein (DUF58 family)